MQLKLAALKARVARLERLSLGLSREALAQRGAEDVLLSRERRQYLAAVQEALAGAEAARVVLAGVVKRMEGDGMTPLSCWAGCETWTSRNAAMPAQTAAAAR